MQTKKFELLRWAVSLSRTQLSKNFELNYRRAVQAIEPEEVMKAQRFHYKEDSLSALISPILMRAAAVTNLSLPWRDLKFERTIKGKPSLIGLDNEWHFNISHQGDYVLLATTHVGPIGVDVMRIDESRNRNGCLAHLETMRNAFSDHELQDIQRQKTERERWSSFYRYWCLKETVLKATGEGISRDLKKVEFKCNEDFLNSGLLIKSSEYVPEGKPQPNWFFEESFVDNDHCAAVATIIETSTGREEANLYAAPFREVLFEELLARAETLNPTVDDAEEYDIWRLKQKKPF